jgi:hypothetical protein
MRIETGYTKTHIQLKINIGLRNVSVIGEVLRAILSLYGKQTTLLPYLTSEIVS